MPSHRRGRDHSRERSESRSRSRSRTPEKVDLPNGVSEISDTDYFVRNDEFRAWLKDEKRKYLDELSSERSRKYFRKFVKAWNRGKLPKSLYYGVEQQAASSQTGYKWAFASKASKADTEAVRAARAEITAATYNRALDDYDDRSTPRSASGSGRVLGPTLPSQGDLVMAREDTEARRGKERELKRKREKLEAKERVEEMVGPREVGREGMLEKKRVKREADRAFRDRGDEGLEADESTLMGGGDSFRDHLARRDAARRRADEKRHGPREDRDAALRERGDALRQKDKATMDMFMQMAKEKFG